MNQPAPASPSVPAANILDAEPADVVTIEAGTMVLTAYAAINSFLVTMPTGNGQRILLQSVRIGSEVRLNMDLAWQPREERHATLEALYFTCEVIRDYLLENCDEPEERLVLVSTVQSLVQTNLALAD